jgi:hypothetical protein
MILKKLKCFFWGHKYKTFPLPVVLATGKIAFCERCGKQFKGYR